jgi:hypothetical protein
MRNLFSHAPVALALLILKDGSGRRNLNPQRDASSAARASGRVGERNS